jgi:HTH-type transcriptional regulator / antitoxin HipB
MAEKTPIGNSDFPEVVIESVPALGELIRRQRKQQALNQVEVAGLGNTGNRFIVDLERGKPTVQLHKVLQVVDLLGLELVLRPKSRTAL